MTIKIYNMHDKKPQKLWDVKVDRSSIIGNPFYLRDESQRNEIINKYHDWFYDCLNSPESERKTFKQELNRLKHLHKKQGKLNLFCWCVPKKCHAEIIKDYLEKML